MRSWAPRVPRDQAPACDWFRCWSSLRRHRRLPEPTMNAMPVKSAGSGDAAASCPACAGGVARAGCACGARADRETVICGASGAGARGGGAGGAAVEAASPRPRVPSRLRREPARPSPRSKGRASFPFGSPARTRHHKAPGPPHRPGPVVSIGRLARRRKTRSTMRGERATSFVNRG